jgi:hypothetical protein
MIVFLVVAGVLLLTTVFIAMPPFPATPDILIDMSNQLAAMIHQAMGVITYLLSAPILYATVIVVIGVFTAEPAYHTIMWVLKKIPVLGIK